MLAGTGHLDSITHVVSQQSILTTWVKFTTWVTAHSMGYDEVSFTTWGNTPYHTVYTMLD